jgi:hypothetical protein
MSNDFHRVEFGTQPAARLALRHSVGHNQIAAPVPPSPAPAQTAPQASPPVANDSVLVPLDQWNRLLGQLGNIHEAGQQLAEARERMGRAETENVFLKERIRDLRAEVQRIQLEGNQSERDDAPTVPVDPPAPEAVSPPGRTLNVEFKIPAWMTRLRRRA